MIRTFPGWWRARYGDEMSALLEARPPGWRELLDLARGALDARLHPVVPSRVPGFAAISGGTAWTVIAVTVLVQPVPPSWPGYLIDIVPLALAGAVCLTIACAGLWMRIADPAGRLDRLAVIAAVGGHGAWIGALAATLTATADAATLAFAQDLAALGTVALGLALLHRDEVAVGALLVVASLGLVVPVPLAWLGFGAAWTVIGLMRLAVPATEHVNPA